MKIQKKIHLADTKSVLKVKKLFSLLLIGILILCISNTGYSQSMTPPLSVEKVFKSCYNSKKSDTFDETKLNSKKWTFRTQGGARRHSIETVNWRKGKNIEVGKQDEGDESKYLSIKASAHGEDKGSEGVVSKFRTRFGFYILKFRMRGLTTGKKPVHHPSVWGAWKNFSTIDFRSINDNVVNGNKNPSNWLELDFVELYDSAPAWKTLTLTQDKPDGKPWVRGKQYVISEKNITDAANWQEIAFEFRPTFIRFWRYKNDKWVAEPKTVYIEETATNAKSKLKDKARASIKPLNAHRDLYWIMSNVFFNPVEDRDVSNDVFFDIDHFLYYPMKKSKKRKSKKLKK